MKKIALCCVVFFSLLLLGLWAINRIDWMESDDSTLRRAGDNQQRDTTIYSEPSPTNRYTPSSTKSTSPEGPPQQRTPELREDKDAPIRTIYRIGEEGVCNAIRATVHSVYSWQDTSRNPAIPSPNNYFIALDVSVVNTGTDTITVNPISFYALNEKGQRFNRPFMVGKPEPTLQLRTLHSGDITRGWIVLEVPQQSTDLYLVYEISLVRGEEIRFRLR